MRTFMAAIVGLVIVGTAARAEDKKDNHGGLSGTTAGKVVKVDSSRMTITVADKNGKEHTVHIGANTNITADGKSVEGGIKGVKAGSSVSIDWQTDARGGKRVGTEIRVMEKLEN